MSQTRPVLLADLQRGFLEPTSPPGEDGLTLIDRLLHQQQQLTAVEAFSEAHAACQIPDQARYYAKLLPATPPGPGEQYAFEVDLDRCSGCKACVTACHSLNGLDTEETWRDVGLLVGGTELLPVMQHVTAACHHCVEPACQSACPVNAYEKDPVTGIVRHLDDQCFGCQYCTLACPYHVPKYHAKKGIVRKCDLCSDRLKAGEAPACVQACPHEAIAIRTVKIDRVKEDAEADHFLPGAPEPYITYPTTSYKTKRVFPRNMLPADYYSISPEHPHWPLIVMLVLTQLSVGAFSVGCLIDAWIDPQLSAPFRPFHATSALVWGLLALVASTGHLGRPLYAFRGILGLRHSWLSREILAFGLFAKFAVLYAAASWVASAHEPLGEGWVRFVEPHLDVLGGLVTATGLVGVFCSVMIYVFTKRDLWNFERTTLRFGLTTALLGATTTWLTLLATPWILDPPTANRLLADVGPTLIKAILILSTAKLLVDLSVLRHLASPRTTSMKRSALLVTGPLATCSLARVGLGWLGGLIMPWLVWHHFHPEAPTLDPVFLVGGVLMWLGTVGGELLERYLFFAAVSAPRMPGNVRS